MESQRGEANTLYGTNKGDLEATIQARRPDTRYTTQNILEYMRAKNRPRQLNIIPKRTKALLYSKRSRMA